MQTTHWHGSISCFKDDSISQYNLTEKGDICPHCSQNPKPMATKFGMVDKVGNDPDPCAKFYNDLIRRFSFPAPAALRAGGRVHSDSGTYFLGGGQVGAFFLFSRSPLHRFLLSLRQITSFRARMCLFGVPFDNKFYIWTPFSPQNAF